ncbi:hypothetical protein BGAL_0227g00150 [Botrytis galanthina]|uniref:Translationally-controlled tumor protein homolog n=1 Tax=Botrytis galanthina TaxID=278940 RepID=A0A4S8R6E8_9HELO|nr:hypothetical protein BGAL_0227g00150 [Botrytis galanthina]
MIIFKDVITGDEIISDSYDLKEVDGIVYEVDCSMITIGAVTVDTGANASAEEAEEGTEDADQKVNNIVNSFRYMKAVKQHLQTSGASDEEVTKFEKGAAAYAKKIVGGFKDYDFYVGESMDPDGMVVLMNYREDGVTPYITVWKHGLTEMKV